MTDKLKPCPFCVSKEVYKHDIALYDTYGEGYVLCLSCHAQTDFMIPRQQISRTDTMS